ncbi:MAG: OB-fold nucleic acid binding domain-containing protein, partial [Chloroflexota bacterium]
MPSALETLVKILKLEREQGYKNTAVIGGLAAYGSKWKNDAHTQARRPEHHILVDELFDILSVYEAVDGRDERSGKITYMLDRITGRVPPPPEYLSRMPAPEPQRVEQTAPPSSPAAQPEAEAVSERTEAPSARAETAAPPQEQPPRRERPERNRQNRREEVPALNTENAARQNQPNNRREDAPPQNQQNRRDEQKSQQKPQRQQNQNQNRQGQKPFGESRNSGEDDFGRLEFDTGGSRKPSKPDIPVPPRLARPPRSPRQQMETQHAADIMRGLNASVEIVKGVGPRMAQLLNKLGIFTINDLLFFLPRRYDDYTKLNQISHLQPNTLAIVVGTVRHTEIRIAQRGRKDFFMVVDDGTAKMGVTFFGQYYLQRQVRVAQQVVLRGQTSMFQGRIQMTNPEIQYLEQEDLQKV